MAYNRMRPQTRTALYRLYNGYQIHAKQFRALCLRGLAEQRNRTEQHITDKGKRELGLAE
jgi:hypothetical protein